MSREPSRVGHPPEPRRGRYGAWTGQRIARLSRAFLLVAGAGLVSAACGTSVEEREAALVELEQLAFVPAGSVSFSGRVGTPVVCENEFPLLIDRFEVSRASWRAFLESRPDRKAAANVDAADTWTEDSGSWAATWMDLSEAREFARARGMRLPTAREWLRVASGTRGLTYPWGSSRAFRVANTYELGLGRPAAVGTFELGATPLGTYDMCGNVWEWVEEPIEGFAREGSVADRAWAMGGAYTSPIRRLWDVEVDGRIVFERLELDPHARGEDVGLRCVVEAREYLTRRSPAWGADADTQRRLVAVGRSFGRDAVPLLDELARAPGASAGLRWLLEGAQGPTSERGP